LPGFALVVPLVLLAAAVRPDKDGVVVTGHAWAPFISPMGEPFRARVSSDDTLARWFQQADRNGDGNLTIDEMQGDADRFFAKLDTSHDGEIDPIELDQYELEIAPEIQVTSRTMRDAGAAEKREKRGAGTNTLMGFKGALQGGARYALLNIPEPVAAADTDFNRGITLAEFRIAAARRFQLLDTARTGKLTLDQLQIVRTAQLARRKGTKDGDDNDGRVGNGLPSAN